MSVVEEFSATPLARPDNAFSQKVTDILSTSYTDSSFRQALAALESKVDKNTSEVRRNLRSDTENDVIKANGLALKEFKGLVEKLESLGKTVEKLNETFDSMEKTAKKAETDTKSTVNDTDILLKEQNKLRIKQAILTAFKKKFVIPKEEVDILTSSSHPIDEEFFRVLNKVKKIHADCDALLATDNQDLGLEIMGKMTTYLDQGYDRLFFVVQRDLKTMKGDDHAFRRQLSRSLKVLSERPTQFEIALKSLSESRQRGLSTEFINALTTDTPHEKAIDFFAFDPLRYVGDILAWIHSEIINERETISSLFDNSSSAETVDWALDPVQTIESLVDTITSGVIKPFKMRIEQVVSSETRIPIVFQLSDKLYFYSSMFSKYLQPTSQLIVTLDKMQTFCMRQFEKCLNEKITDIKEHLLVNPSDDLQPPEFLLDSTVDLKSVLKTYEASIKFNPESENSEIKPIIQDLTEPYLECCNRIASDLPTPNSEIFTLNCIDTVKMTLQLFFNSTQFKIDQLDNRIAELADVLTNRQLAQYVSESGLKPYLKYISLDGVSIEDSVEELSSNPLFSKEALSNLSFTLDNFLPSASLSSHQYLFHLSSPRLATDITNSTNSKYTTYFAVLEEKVISIYGVEESRINFPRTYNDVCVLLGVESNDGKI